jgi:hypothetical protein
MKSMSGMPLIAAAVVFGLSAVVLGATVVDALRVDDTPGLVSGGEESLPEPAEMAGTSEAGAVASDDEALAPDAAAVASGAEVLVPEAAAWVPGDPGSGVPLRGISYPRVTNDEILDAVNQDLFQPDRTPPLQRYLFPGERPSAAQTARDIRRRSEPDLRVVGTAIAGGLALAMVQPEDSIPFSVLLGEMVDGYLLASVSEEMVTLTRDGAEFYLPVMEPQRGRSSSDRRGNDRNQNADVEAARALAERVQQMLQGARGQMMRGGGEPGGLPTARFQIPRMNDLSIAVPITVRGGRPGGGGGGGEDYR